MQQRPVQPNPTPSIYRSHSNSISEYAGPRSVSGPQHAPVGPVTMGMPNGYQTNGTNRWFRTRKTPDQEALEIGLLLSEQEAEFGINMYDSLTPADDPEIEYLTSQGYSTDEAILIIFERRYYRSNAPYRNEFGMQMEMNARGSGGGSVVGRNSYESPQQQYADYYSEPISRLSPYSSHQNMVSIPFSNRSKRYLFSLTLLSTWKSTVPIVEHHKILTCSPCKNSSIIKFRLNDHSLSTVHPWSTAQVLWNPQGKTRSQQENALFPAPLRL